MVSSDEICRSAAHTVCSIEDLLSKILAGLPLGSLRVSKSVCKRWLHLITDPSFNALRSRSPKADDPCFLLLQAFSVFDYVPLAVSPSIRSTCFPFYAENLEVLQSCNGLLLCYAGPDKFYAYNPTISHFKLLPPPPVWKPNGLFRYIALGFDPTVSPHYKVVYPGRRPGGLVHVQIYSSETGTWKACAAAQTNFSLPSFVMFNSRRVVYWHGAIHWLSRIHVYHLTLDEESILQVEDHASLYGIRYGGRDKLFVSRNCLLLARMLQEPLQMNVYEMKKKKNYYGWSIKYHVNLQSAGNLLGPYFNVVAIVLGERDEDSFLVLEENLFMLIRYNISSNTFHQLCDLTQTRLRDTQYDCFLFTPSLVGV